MNNKSFARGHELDLAMTRVGSSSCPLRDIIAEIRSKSTLRDIISCLMTFSSGHMIYHVSQLPKSYYDIIAEINLS